MTTIIEDALAHWVDQLDDEALVAVVERALGRIVAEASPDAPSAARGWVLTAASSGRLRNLYERQGHATLGPMADGDIRHYYAVNVVRRRKFQ